MMKLAFHVLCFLISGMVFAAPASLTKRKPSSAGLIHPHVFLMHMDGTVSEVFKKMVENGQLPHYRYLLDRGRINYESSTVDKSETMKVILSYLTSSVDSEVVGWWQFSRDNFAFRNFWLDPTEVINYALGLEFPRRPTIHDYLAAHGKTTISGFALHRRSVSFENYSRAYFEGLTNGVMNHQYLDQAHATTDGLISNYLNNAKKNIVPTFAHALLAPADEFAHLDGITDNSLGAPPGKSFVTKCFGREKKGKDREKGQTEKFFKYLDALDKEHNSSVIYVDRTYAHGRVVAKKGRGHFRDVLKLNETKRFCVDLPVLSFYSRAGGKKTKEVTNAYYVLGMISMDIQLGRILNTLQGLKIKGCKGGKDVCYERRLAGLPGLLKDHGRDTLFSQTLFVFTGDHGMVDSKSKMDKCEGEKCSPKYHGRSEDSIRQSFVELLNSKLSLGQKLEGNKKIGVDDGNLPDFLKFPHLDAEWVRTAGLEREVAKAKKWALAFFNEIRSSLKNELARKYWYLLFLKRSLVYPKLDEKLGPYKETVLHTLEGLYLKGIEEYRLKEVPYLKKKYDQHVAFVYGGGARNNAEIFLPASRDGKTTWSRRPSYNDIIGFRGKNEKKTLLQVLLELESVGVVFIRKNNPLEEGEDGRMEIAVFGEKSSEARIFVDRDSETRQLVYGYKVLTEQDPLRLKRSPGPIQWGTYSEWNDLSVTIDSYYHNPVAGIGSYLYSKNSSIGDILVMHAQGWNFGDNSGGHGGIHAEEKKTILMVSGPDITPGKLMGRAIWQTEATEDEGYRLVRRPFETNTTVLDIAPTVLNWLGYERNALDDFGTSSLFRDHLRNWVKGQRRDIQSKYGEIEDIRKLFKWAEFEKVDIKRLDPYIKRLFAFIPEEMPELVNTQKEPQMGNVLVIEGTYDP